MSIQTINPETSLDGIWNVLVWEEARLLRDKNAQDLAPEVANHLTRWAAVRAGQLDKWRAEIIAQAGVDASDDDLDDTTDAIDRELQHIDGDRNSARYLRYFKKTRSVITRLGLENQLDIVRGWVDSLKTEAETALSALGATLGANVTGGDAAVAARRASAAATADHRVRDIVRLVDDINAARRTRYGVLIQRAEALKLPKDWPNRFFKKGESSSKKAGA
jgi:hypothetical protein